ncbi:hemerythrin domain-containing protein [Rhizobium sp. RU36D]|uniref:hemerythrin domain-containing protein n=1 Tax=Rhizobium sp. RU36D TaxID=1907415 RepID=UPI0009D7D68A|nr:hemerythrin domain-containing protein [Rhizobium sp. RU36D]SMC73335.1 Hemerythrin HHE cation binding domain-containing protein [Rhizobium sp. RU36D]
MPEAHACLTAEDVARLERYHQRLLSLCIQLEEAAAELDDGRVPQDLFETTERILPLLAVAQEFEERIFFPDFDRNAGSCFAAMMIEKLKAEHRCDHRAAEELSLTLQSLWRGRCKLAFPVVSSMLRGFQECLRRHISAEQLILESLLVAEAEGREMLA